MSNRYSTTTLHTHARRTRAPHSHTAYIQHPPVGNRVYTLAITTQHPWSTRFHPFCSKFCTQQFVAAVVIITYIVYGNTVVSLRGVAQWRLNVVLCGIHCEIFIGSVSSRRLLARIRVARWRAACQVPARNPHRATDSPRCDPCRTLRHAAPDADCRLRQPVSTWARHWAAAFKPALMTKWYNLQQAIHALQAHIIRASAHANR